MNNQKQSIISLNANVSIFEVTHKMSAFIWSLAEPGNKTLLHKMTGNCNIT
jgi:hypothetical protein